MTSSPGAVLRDAHAVIVIVRLARVDDPERGHAERVVDDRADTSRSGRARRAALPRRNSERQHENHRRDRDQERGEDLHDPHPAPTTRTRGTSAAAERFSALTPRGYAHSVDVGSPRMRTWTGPDPAIANRLPRAFRAAPGRVPRTSARRRAGVSEGSSACAPWSLGEDAGRAPRGLPRVRARRGTSGCARRADRAAARASPGGRRAVPAPSSSSPTHPASSFHSVVRRRPAPQSAGDPLGGRHRPSLPRRPARPAGGSPRSALPMCVILL